MKETLKNALLQAENLNDVRSCLLFVLQDTRGQNGLIRIGYVAEVITSDGPEQIPFNIKKLADYTDQLSHSVDFPIFSAPYVFTPEVFERLPERSLPHVQREVRFRAFWRSVLQSGYVTNIFMTPRWSESIGASEEHQVATANSLTIHYL